MLFSIPHSHSALPGHFPGNPVVPGVVMLDYIMAAAKDALPLYRVDEIKKLKWLRPLLPEQSCEIRWAAVRDNQVRFACYCADVRIAEGSLLLSVLS